MSVREIIQRHSAITTSATIVIIVVALIAIGVQLANSKSSGAIAMEAYFSTDDGASWFADGIQKVPPFTKGGKEAVLAHVYRCANGKPFTAYLERYTPEGKKAIEDAYAKADPSAPPNDDIISGLRFRHGEIKKPGDSRWISQARNPTEYTAIMKRSCPSGNMDDLEMVMP